MPQNPEPDTRSKLLAYVEKRAFDPGLTAGRPPLAADAERQARAVQVLRDQLCELSHSMNAAELVRTFRGQLRSREGRWVNAELKALGLTAPGDVSGDFEDEALKLDVRA